MEATINHTIFKLFGLMPIFQTKGSAWKILLNTCYSLSVITFITVHQFAIYYLQLERDFAGWFISASVLFTSFIALLQTLTSAKGLQFLMLELASIDSLISTCNATSKRHYSAIFYAMYCIGLTRGIFRMVLMIQLGLRSPSFAVQLLVPSIIVLVLVNLQIYLMELIAAQLEAITAELSSSLEDAGRCNTNEADTVYRCSCTLQRAECLYGRLQKCLLMVNALFGWSTAAIVVLVFVGITFQFRVPMYPLPFYAQIIEVLYSIFILFCLCRASSHATEKVNEIKRVLLKPFYNALLWDQVHNFIVRTKLQPFEFTANGLYSINYSLFGSTLAASATYIVIMLQFEHKTLEVL
ncbi:uncharacterized protein LOC133391793 [Anopheles gambiae]|uniref:uncharacterized protein LOC133391793 n=1 Tax=Anopheles gambiae TaxID=7165 RepID=UPI002AC898F9|nr:uncharacterized protein LOC133391793 [Anopheles gambiae]